ncbi:MAG: hypothetical protein PHD10_01315 [Bacilli bacterium]|nr:hypothetical protein [Bacilli bacterium]MDD4607761.1 hypothetical protein [Bacilli bacterium]
MDIIIIMALIGFVVFFFKRFVNVIYLIPAIDIFLRIITVIKTTIADAETYAFLNKWFPANIPSVIDKYTGGVVYNILFFVYIIIYVIFEYYLIRQIFSKK